MRKIFWMLTIAGVYFYVITSEEEVQLLSKAEGMKQYMLKKWKELDLKWHVHTAECFPKKR